MSEGQTVDGIAEEYLEGPSNMNRRDALRTIGAGAALLLTAACGMRSGDREVSGTPGALAALEAEATPAIDAEEFAAAMAEVYKGFAPGQIVAGSDVNFEGAPQERGTGSFGDKTLTSEEELRDYLRSDTKGGQKASEMVAASIGVSVEELDATLDSGRYAYIPVQTLPESVIVGTTYLDSNNAVHKATNPRQTQGRDVMLMLYDIQAKKMIGDGSVRADCNQPGCDVIRPLQPGEQVTPVEVPAFEVPGQPLPPEKNPALSPQLNDRIPAQQRGGTPSGGRTQTPADPYVPPSEVPDDGYVRGTVDKPKPPQSPTTTVAGNPPIGPGGEVPPTTILPPTTVTPRR